MSLSAVQRTGSVFFAGVDVVDCAPGESILLAGLRAGLDLPYECASGGCGTCRATLLDGRVTNRWESSTGLTERDRRKGDRILMCQSVAEGRCEVLAPRPPIANESTPGAVAVPLPARSTGRLRTREMLSHDTGLFTVDLDREMPYLAGQFVVLDLGSGVRRAYSMSRPFRPGPAGYLELLVRAKPGGAASEVLFQRLAAGDVLHVEGPFGKAFVQTSPSRPVVCLAGGTGLAPVLAIADQLVGDAPGRPVDVYVGARHLDDVVLGERLDDLSRRGARITLVVEHHDGRPHPRLGEVARGLALDVLAEDVEQLAGHDLYVAGPSGMVDATLRRLVRNGTARADRVFFDRFIG